MAYACNHSTQRAEAGPLLSADTTEESFQDPKEMKREQAQLLCKEDADNRASCVFARGRGDERLEDQVSAASENSALV